MLKLKQNKFRQNFLFGPTKGLNNHSHTQGNSNGVYTLIINSLNFAKNNKKIFNA